MLKRAMRISRKQDLVQSKIHKHIMGPLNHLIRDENGHLITPKALKTPKTPKTPMTLMAPVTRLTRITLQTPYPSRSIIKYRYETENPGEELEVEEENVINIGKEKEYRGSLLVIPTPIGNIGDISLRQIEALKNMDILACEDTRTTGKLLLLLHKTKLRRQFKSEFGVDIDDFVNNPDHPTSPQQNAKSQPEEGESLDHTNIPHSVTKNNNNILNEVLDHGSDTNTNIYNTEEITMNNQTPGAKLKISAIKELLELEVKSNRMTEMNEVDSKAEEAKRLEEMSDVEEEFFGEIKEESEYSRMKEKIRRSDKIFTGVNREAVEYDKKRNMEFIAKQMYKKGNSKGLPPPTHSEYERDSHSSYKDHIENENNADDDFILGIDDSYIGQLHSKIRASKEKKGHGIMISLYTYNESLRVPKLIRLMKLGLRIGLVSESGMPTISDPGSLLISETIDSGLQVECLPGCTASTTAFTASGLHTPTFHFQGYLPKSKGPKQTQLRFLRRLDTASVIYESPQRVGETLEAIREVYGGGQFVYMGLELSKRHERHVRGLVNELLYQLKESEELEVRGEVTLVIGPYQGDEIDEEVGEVDQGVDVFRMAKILHQKIDMTDLEFRTLLFDIAKDTPHSFLNNIIKQLRPKQSKIMKYNSIFENIQNNQDGK